MQQQNERIRAVDVAGREMPHNPDAEAAVVSAALTDGMAQDALVDVLPNSLPFYVDANRRIWDALLWLRSERKRVDIQTVAAYLRDRDELTAIGGMSYLARITDATPSVANAVEHAELVRDQHVRRRLIDAGQIIVGEGYSWRGSVREYTERARATLDATLAEAAAESDDLDVDTIEEVIERRRETLTEQWKGLRDWRGLSTGVRAWDELTVGARWGEQHVVAALTGGGKSTLGLQACVAMAGKEFNGERVGVLVINGEMSNDDLADRQLCALGTISDRELQSGDFSEHYDRQQLDAAAAYLSRLPIAFSRTGSKTHEQIRAMARKLHRRWNELPTSDGERPLRLRVLLVDYLQKMKMPRRQGLRSDESIAEFSGAMKDLALELGLHVMLISQFNREGSKSGDPRPQDLAGGAAIENDADLITFINRPDSRGEPDLEDFAELVLLKGRKVKRSGRRPVRYEGRYFRIVDPHQLDVERWKQAHRRMRAKSESEKSWGTRSSGRPDHEAGDQ